MQSKYGSRQFTLITKVSRYANSVKITLLDDDKYSIVGNRNVDRVEEEIKEAIKSLERKAGCKLYYVLLIDTDGNYL